MPTISLRIPDSIHRQLEDAAEGNGVSVSEWTRRAIESQLGIEGALDPKQPATLAKRDRRVLVLLHQVLERLSPDESEHHKGVAQVLQEGFTAEYSNVINLSEELSQTDCKLVHDLLEMFSIIRRSVAELGMDSINQAGDLEPWTLEFRGFDFNDRRESRLASFATYLINSGRWTDLADCFGRDRDGGNSHAPMLDSYLRMLDVYEPMRSDVIKRVTSRQSHLTIDELRAIGHAALHPEQRPPRP